MEEVKEYERKRRNWKWLLVIPIIVIMGVVLSYGFYTNKPNSQSPIEQTTTTSPQESLIQETGNELLFKEMKEFPSKIEFNLDGSTRVSVRVESDKPVGFQMGIEKNGIYNHKAGDLNGMKTSQDFKIDINENEGGLYQFEFVTDENDPPTYAKISITELAKL